MPKHSLTISTPNPMTCIWTVTVPKNKTAFNLLQFSINYGTNADKNNIRLTIYDSNSIRDNRFINLSYFNETKLSSTNSIITVYSIIDIKKESSLTLKLSTTGILS
jgi:hypothetical protein